jgi:hypothetical protein
MKSICFHCQFVGVGVSEARCPHCGYPLITNMAGAQLGTRDLEKLFAAPTPQHARPPTPLPGVSAEPRQAQLLMQRRREKALAAAEAKKAQAERERELAAAALAQVARRKTLKGFVAASAAVAVGLLLALNLYGVL